jgi:hypothetical protein
VRPYSLTGGRTHTHHPLLVETFVATTETAWAAPAMPEEEAILRLCTEMRTVAEVAALLSMPLGVVRVLLSDLADQGRIHVHGTGHGPEPDRALLERVLHGLRRL